MSIKKYLAAGSLILITVFAANPQETKEDLISSISKLPNDSLKANQYLEIAYASQDSQMIAYIYADSSLQLSKAINHKKGIVRSSILMGNIKRSYGEYPSAQNHLLQALNLIKEINDIDLESKLYNSLAFLYYYQGPVNFGKAIDYNFKAIEIQNIIKDSVGLARSYSHLGTIYTDPISKETRDLDKGLEYYKTALDISVKIKDKHQQASMLGTIGFLYKDKGEFQDALLLMNQSLEMFKTLGSKWGEMAAHYRLGILFRDMGNYKKSAEQLKISIEMAAEEGNRDLENNAHEAISETYNLMGNYKNALDHYYKSVEIKFELYNKERIDKLAEYEKKFETTQKEKEIEILKREAELSEVHIKKQRIVTFSIISGAGLLLLVVILLFRSNRIKQKANETLSQKNDEIVRQKEEIESQKDEIETQRDMVVNQKEMIESVHGKLTDSLRYAQSIQAAILPSDKILQQISSDYFVLMKPCELVSGDFFWATTFDHYHIFCIADCTGHGVPGAFMSILGINALNDIVARHRVNKANEILGYLRESVIEALSQNDPQHFHKDGMDISLCVFNTKNRELQFAGAGLPLWLVSSYPYSEIELEKSITPEAVIHNGFILYEIKGDNMPVGHSPRMEPFTNKLIKLNDSRITIYLSTDGFADQLGENSKSKFGNAQLKKKILENASSDFSNQKQTLENVFTSWLGTNYQIDDVTVLGIKI